MDVITFPVNLYTTSGLSILLHGVISRQMIKTYKKENVLTFIFLVFLDINFYRHKSRQTKFCLQDKVGRVH